MAVQYYEGIGRRKRSTARVRVMNGSGNFIVNFLFIGTGLFLLKKGEKIKL